MHPASSHVTASVIMLELRCTATSFGPRYFDRKKGSSKSRPRHELMEESSHEKMTVSFFSQNERPKRRGARHCGEDYWVLFCLVSRALADPQVRHESIRRCSHRGAVHRAAQPSAGHRPKIHRSPRGRAARHRLTFPTISACGRKKHARWSARKHARLEPGGGRIAIATD